MSAADEPTPQTSEWMKVMLEEIARKKLEQEQARAEDERRREVVIESAHRTDD